MESDTCVSVIASLREEFASRFAGVRTLAADFKLFTGPFEFPVYDAPATCRCRWLSYSAMMNWRRGSTTLLQCPSSATPSRNFPKYIAHVQCVVAMFGCTYRCEQLFFKNKVHTQSLAFAPCSWTPISRTFFCCRAHPSSRTLKYFFMASSTSRLTDLPALQYTYCNNTYYIYNGLHPHFGVFVCHSGPRAAPEGLIWPSLWKGCPPLPYIVLICKKWKRMTLIDDIVFHIK